MDMNALIYAVPAVGLTIVSLASLSVLREFARRGNSEPRPEKYPRSPKKKEAQEDLVEIEI